MKKYIIIFIMLFSFAFIKDVNAAGNLGFYIHDCEYNGNGKIEACTVYANAIQSDSRTAFSGFEITYKNSEPLSIVAKEGWTVTEISRGTHAISSEPGSNYTYVRYRVVYSGDAIPAGDTDMFVVNVTPTGGAGDQCELMITDLGDPIYFCKMIYNGTNYVYYNSQGQIVTESEYNNDCNPKCELKDGVYYGPNGQVLANELAMLTACNSFICQSYQGPSGTTYYFNKNGSSVSQSSMISSCSCTKVGNVYYKNNMVVATNEADMIIDCYNPVCRSYQGPSGTTYYFGKNGQRVSNEAAMKESCGCQQVGNKYYDANGVETTKLNYIKTCQHPVCQEVDGYYFDSSGNNVTQAQMLKSCNACKEENGHYYDANGVETTKLNYIKSCQNPVCSQIDGYYFDSNGNNVTEAQMRKSCFACKEENGTYYNSDGIQTTKINYIISCKNPKCTEYDGYYFDKNGNQVADAAAVIQSCENPKCMKLDDNTYFDKNGNRVNSLEAYAKSCLVCQQYEDKYVKKDGTITEDVNEYIVSCKSPNCEKVIIDNKTYYYDKNGKQLKDEDEFEFYCTMHYCKEITMNGKTTYYGFDGTETTKENYEDQCKGKYICTEVIDNEIPTYYDKFGNQVSKDIFLQQCFINSCKVIGNKYYDKDGNEVTKVKYQQQCQVNKCEKIGDKYYDKNGNEVTKDEFDKDCNPSTGSWIPTTLLLLLGAGGATIYITRRKKVLFKI